MPRVILAFLAGMIILVGNVPRSLAVEIYMFIDGVRGEIAGGSPYVEWSRVESASWGHGEPPAGSALKYQFSRITITKINDSISPLLALAATGVTKPYREVKFELVKPVGNTHAVTSRIKITGARVTNYQTSASGPGLPMDSISFGFDTITWINLKSDPTGQQLPGNAACFDLRMNTTCSPNF